MKENTYRKRENEVPQGANRSGFRIEPGEVRDDAQGQTEVQLMMISLFDVHVISLSFFFSPSPKVKCKEEKKKKKAVRLFGPLRIETHPVYLCLASSAPSPCPPQSIPDTRCQLGATVKLHPSPFAGAPPCPHPYHPHPPHLVLAG